MIDEFQDIDSLQYELMEVLCAYHKNLFIVGDPDQTIYTWRGANVRFLLDFDKHFPDVQTIMMLKNYRSSPQILAAANSLIGKNQHRIKKNLAAVRPDNGPVMFHFAGNAEKEASWIVSRIGEQHQQGIPYRQMTILYRAHYVTRPLEEALLKAKIPYRIYSGIQFFARAEIKDALSYLRMVIMQDDLSFRRIVNLPKRNLGIRRMEFLEKYAAEHHCSLYQALKNTLDQDIFRGTKADRFTDLIEAFSTGAHDRPTSELLSALLKAKIPYRIYSGIQFFARAEIKDALSYLRMVIMQDDLSFRRIVNLPKRNLGIRRMEFLEKYAAEQHCTLYQALKNTLDQEIFRGTKAGQFVDLIEAFSTGAHDRPTSELLSVLLNESGYEIMLRTEGSQERLDNLAELKQSIYEYETMCGEEATPEHYLAHVAMFTNTDADDTCDRIKLMTVHAAKGLEFPLVFLCGMNEGIFPSRKIRDRHGMEEERRLAFVAMTRAEKRLFLSAAAGRNFDGSPRYPSRFVLDIDSPLVEYTQKLSDSLIADTREYIRNNRLRLPEEQTLTGFAKGSRVRHEYLGEGTVLKVDHDHNNYLIKFDKIATPRSIAFRVKLAAV